MYEKSHKDSESEFGVGMVCGEGDEAFRELVQCDGNGGLEADGKESVCVNVVMVLLFGIISWEGRGRGSSSFPVGLQI